VKNNQKMAGPADMECGMPHKGNYSKQLQSIISHLFPRRRCCLLCSYHHHHRLLLHHHHVVVVKNARTTRLCINVLVVHIARVPCLAVKLTRLVPDVMANAIARNLSVSDE
jgi:hypothetical protein